MSLDLTAAAAQCPSILPKGSTPDIEETWHRKHTTAEHRLRPGLSNPNLFSKRRPAPGALEPGAGDTSRMRVGNTAELTLNVNDNGVAELRWMDPRLFRCGQRRRLYKSS
jgi:hypothetical protein